MQEEKSPRARRTRSYVEEAFRQIQTKPDIVDIVIVNSKGNPVKSTMEASVAIEFVGLYNGLVQKVQSALQKMDKYDELMMLRVRTKNGETLITPDETITVMVVQNAVDRIET